jgi:hypothetical protein
MQNIRPEEKRYPVTSILNRLYTLNEIVDVRRLGKDKYISLFIGDDKAEGAAKRNERLNTLSKLIGTIQSSGTFTADQFAQIGALASEELQSPPIFW